GLIWRANEDKAAGSNGDNTKYTAQIVLQDEGEYEIRLKDSVMVDAAGNSCKMLAASDSEYISRFIIDKTKPEQSISFREVDSTPNHAPRIADDIEYFSAGGRVGRLTIVDKSFDEEQVTIDFLNTAKNAENPRIGSWVHNGDKHHVDIEFMGDGYYELGVSANDLAGNDMTPEFNVKKFFIDSKAPGISVEGVENERAYATADSIQKIKISCTDITRTDLDVQLVYKFIDGDNRFNIKSVNLYPGMDTSDTNKLKLDIETYNDDHVISYPNSADPSLRSSIEISGNLQDGLYYLYVSASDMAANLFEEAGELQRNSPTGESVTLNSEELHEHAEMKLITAFSINENGPTFDMTTGSELGVMDKGYFRSSDIEKQPIVISIYNPDDISSVLITCSSVKGGGSTKTYEENADYSVLKKSIEDDDSESGYGWYTETYQMNNENYLLRDDIGRLVENDDMYTLQFVADGNSTTIAFSVDDIKPVLVSAEVDDVHLKEKDAVIKADKADFAFVIDDTNFGSAYAKVDDKNVAYEVADSTLTMHLGGSAIS
ncbi:MAG: hypothetical protein IJB54_01950, partial [Firmicutes bacterium]|nr:hypothetical protein [Bacillota bacterium]